MTLTRGQTVLRSAQRSHVQVVDVAPITLLSDFGYVYGISMALVRHWEYH